MSPHLAVVIPAHNEAATIREVASQALNQASRVFVVDDRSQDNTAGQLEGLGVTVLRHPDNRGKAASLWTGIQAALADGAAAVVTLDADGQHDPADIPRLAAAALSHPHCLIIGARLRRRSTMPRLRRFGNAVADFWIGWAAGQPIRDSQSGFRLYPAALLRQVQLAVHRERGFVFESELLIVAARLGFPSRLVPIDSSYPGGARASHYRPWTDTTRIVGMVAGKLLSRGLYPLGLLRSLGLLGGGDQKLIDGEHAASKNRCEKQHRQEETL